MIFKVRQQAVASPWWRWTCMQCLLSSQWTSCCPVKRRKRFLSRRAGRRAASFPAPSVSCSFYVRVEQKVSFCAQSCRPDPTLKKHDIMREKRRRGNAFRKEKDCIILIKRKLFVPGRYTHNKKCFYDRGLNKKYRDWTQSKKGKKPG